MAREELLALLVSCAARPHSRCLYRLPTLARQSIRYASTSKPTPSEGSQAQRIPLHVGLDRNPDHMSAISKIPIPKGEKGENFTPSILASPLGVPYPPRPGENSPIDYRTLKQKKDDFTNYEKALERRRIYLRSFFRPYFQEWRRVDHHKGKSFVSNDRLFRRDKALYFPNIWGQTLAKEGDGPEGGRDTTPSLTGKVSLIGIQSGHWAEEQVDTFIGHGEKENPGLEKIIKENNGLVQRVDINIQGDLARAWLVKLFSWRLRRKIPEDRWERYFKIKLPRDIRRGLTDDVRDAMGLLNSQVGYVYLVDSSCKIRWAGSGHAWKGEVEGLNSAILRLVKEEQKLSSQTATTITKSAPKSPTISPKPQSRNAIDSQRSSTSIPTPSIA